MDPKIFSMGVESTLLALAFLPTMGVRAWLPDYPLSGREVQAKGGYYTDSGKYLGGIPKYDDELEQYGCTAYNRNSTCYVAGSNATACLTWTANEIGTDEYEVGTCYCSAITNDEYCSAWACSQTEVSTTPTCSGEGEYRTCWYDQEEETTRCACLEESDTGAYCSSWRCVETEADGTQEFEKYTCVREPSSETYCEAWTGVIESAEEVEVSTCECIQELSGGSVCSYWECNERGLTKCSHGGPSWCNLGISVGVGGLFGSLGASMLSWGLFGLDVSGRNPNCATILKCILGFLWMAGWSAGVIVWGGEDGGMYAGTWWGAIILFGLLCRCRRDWDFDCDCKTAPPPRSCNNDQDLCAKQPSAGVPHTAAAKDSGDAEKNAGEAFVVNLETPPAHPPSPPANVENPEVHLGETPGWGDGPPAFVEVPGET